MLQNQARRARRFQTAKPSSSSVLRTLNLHRRRQSPGERLVSLPGGAATADIIPTFACCIDVLSPVWPLFSCLIPTLYNFHPLIPHIHPHRPCLRTHANMVMKKKTTYTNITPIPSFIPRQLALDILHSHGEIIELNPLVTGFQPIKAPRDAPSDEFYATWYEISQRIQFVPGIGKLGSGNIKFNGCFHDMPWGLQTHTYAPGGVDLRNKWQIAGNQPDEEPVQRELGIGAPPEGLYLREDIEIKCNVTMVNFVKKELKAASKVLVERLIKKAELLDAGALSAIMENGKLKTHNPADRSSKPGSQRPSSQQLSPGQQPYHSPQVSTFPQSYAHSRNNSTSNEVIMELPGDFSYPQQSQPPPSHDNRMSNTSDVSAQTSRSPDPRWSNDYQSSVSSRPSSYASDGGMRSPGMDQKSFAAELPTMEETREEHDDKRRRQSLQSPPEKYSYNPQDYAQYSQPPQYSAYTPGR
ncbi:unnamed protein product [Periconia digitata]|uniref:DUF7053 domain-containing protein n=1 Tax=Periconia digitata TaxID=1303443 RepID=A0A9W4UR54_9PLEO|nr:unnamed protein product [Periconia digitata]